ncbi:MAG: SIMPL domain-containing protein [Candidatus Eremiobacteraeota bacterium]|nr:SIMPL domain-containing protein [Candidatus Eremiobacteraeota bacterium]
MIKRFAAVFALSLMVLPIGAQAAQSAPAQITVTGQGTVTQTPDLAFLNATIATNDDVAQNATAKNQRAYDALVAAMKKIGVLESDVRTNDINVSFNPRPQPEPGPNGTAILPPRNNEIYGYIANRGITVTLHKTALAGKALDAAVKAGVTNIGGVSFGASQSQSAYNQATRLAVEDAHRQAQAMASAAGLRIVRIKMMQQGAPAQPPSPVPFAAKMALASVDTNLPPNDVRVYSTVTITYEATP